MKRATLLLIHSVLPTLPAFPLFIRPEFNPRPWYPRIPHTHPSTRPDTPLHTPLHPTNLHTSPHTQTNLHTSLHTSTHPFPGTVRPSVGARPGQFDVDDVKVRRDWSVLRHRPRDASGRPLPRRRGDESNRRDDPWLRRRRFRRNRTRIAAEW